MKLINSWIKRVFDFTAAFSGLLIFSPFLTVVMITIWLQDFKSPFYISDRVGKSEKVFSIVKLRSMVVGADKTGVDSTAYNDARITVVGHVIRKYKLDELSQLWNVLKGDMSLVGPRPNVQRETDLYTQKEKDLLKVKPGITDFASIVFADEGQILSDKENPDLAYNQLIRPGKSELGLFYIQKQSLFLDILIILITLISIISREQALILITFVLKKLGASTDLLIISRRKAPLKPMPPVGADTIVTDRIKRTSDHDHGAYDQSMRVWIFQTGEPLQVDPVGLRPMRAMNLSNALIEQGHEVVLWSSNFDHFSKTHRFKNKREIQYSKNLKVKLIPSRGYNSNIGISRLIDHFGLALNLKKMLKTQLPPDVAFIGYPPIEAPWVIAKWLKKHNTPFLIDVKDAWPELFVRVFPGRFQGIIKIMFIPQLIMMKKIFQIADGISAPTQDFLDWCLQKLPREQNSCDRVTPITAPDSIIPQEELKKAEIWLDELNIKDSGIFRVCYVGSLTKSLNFSPIIEAAKHLPIEFVFAGNGSSYETTIDQCKHLSNIKFLGWIDRAQINRLYARSNLMIAPYVNSFDFQLNITNKFYDAMSNGKPFITCLSGAITKVMNENNIGIKYDGDKISSLTAVLATLIDDRNSLIKLGNNARHLYQQQYTSNKVYSELVRDLYKLCKYDS